MRRMIGMVSGLALGLALVSPATVPVRAQPAQDPAALDKAMKVVGPAFGATRKAVEAADMAGAKTNAQALSKAFDETEGFFKSHGKADGVEWSQASKKAADAVAMATSADAAKAQVSELNKLCAGCHAQYRGRAADGTYNYKPGN